MAVMPLPKNLLAPILFYPKADGSLGLDNEKCSERDHDVMVHEVRYDPKNVVTYVQIYLNPFDTGSMEQWLKLLMKLNLIITRNGLMAGLAKFNLTRSLLKGEALQHFNKKAKSLKTKQMHIMRYASVQYLDTFFQRMLCRCKVLLVKGLSTQSNDHQRVCRALASTRQLFYPISPTWQNDIKDQ